MNIDHFVGDRRFLSNFYPCAVEFGGVTYPSVEHAYQAAKTYDDKARERIRQAPTPGSAKMLGRMAHLRDGWDDHLKEEVMLQLLRQKFSTEPLQGMLLATGYDALAEGNHWGDRYWGVVRGEGKNRLGILLMQVREELRNKEVVP